MFWICHKLWPLRRENDFLTIWPPTACPEFSLPGPWRTTVPCKSLSGHPRFKSTSFNGRDCHIGTAPSYCFPQDMGLQFGVAHGVFPALFSGLGGCAFKQTIGRCLHMKENIFELNRVKKVKKIKNMSYVINVVVRKKTDFSYFVGELIKYIKNKDFYQRYNFYVQCLFFL